VSLFYYCKVKAFSYAAYQFSLRPSTFDPGVQHSIPGTDILVKNDPTEQASSTFILHIRNKNPLSASLRHYHKASERLPLSQSFKQDRIFSNRI
jgi:hypothetical protein